MGFFGMLFWIAVLWFVIRAWRRSERCAAIGPRGYAPGWYAGSRSWYRDSTPAPERTRPDDREDYIESLETRLSELEERLDFTERLLAGRNELSGKA
jgi:hypothetical protein